MLNIDLMTEQEVIDLLHDEQFLEDLTKGNIVAFFRGEEINLELSHLVSRISPRNQDNGAQLDIKKMSKLISTQIIPHIKNTLKNDTEKNLEICHNIYAPLIRLINKLSINQAKELVSMPNIKQLLINPQINTGITYTALSWIEKPSVIRLLNDLLDIDSYENKKEKLKLQEIKLALRNTIRQYKDSDTVKEHLKNDYQRVSDKEKFYQQKNNYYQSTKGMLNFILSKIITAPEERRSEREQQENIEYFNNLILSEQKHQNSRR